MDSIFHRISVRKYADKSVEKEKIMQILRAVRRKIASIRSGFIFWSETEFECGREPCQAPMTKTFKNGEQHDNSIML